MTLSGLYLDEDVQAEALVRSLRARGLDVLTTTEAGMSMATDEEQLNFASSRKRVLATCNIADFARIHNGLLSTSVQHAGIILIPPTKVGPR